MFFPKTALVFLLLRQSTGADDDNTIIEWSTLTTTLPKALSDMTATLVASDGLIYVAGGCDRTIGNTYFVDLGEFDCGYPTRSISTNFYAFDPTKESFDVNLLDLPRARYRHAAAAVDKQIWLVGGRDEEGNLIPEVDVYNIENGEWFSPGTLPDEYQTSDHAAFSDGKDVYVVGGYPSDYFPTKDLVFRINAAESIASTSNNTTLVIDKVSSLLVPRGDVQAAISDDSKTAYVSGGFNHENEWCAALDSVEQYDIATDTWKFAPDLKTGRADKALVELNGYIYAMGGEAQIENKCNITPDDLPQPGELTVPVDDVEVLDTDGEEWKVLASLPEHRFRFAAVGWDDTNTVYTFGGQESFDEECECFRTSDRIVVYRNVPTTSDASFKGASIGVVVAIMTGLFAAVL